MYSKKSDRIRENSKKKFFQRIKYGYSARFQEERGSDGLGHVTGQVEFVERALPNQRVDGTTRFSFLQIVNKKSCRCDFAKLNLKFYMNRQGMNLSRGVVIPLK